MSSLTLIAREVKQRDNTFYETALSAVDLTDEDRFKTDRWSNTTQRGYQREINDPHSRRISQYIKRDDSLMPQPIVLNVRGALNVKPIVGVAGAVSIEIPALEACYVVDGQHRVESIRRLMSQSTELDALDDFEFGVTIINVSLEDEMRQFGNLNGTANRPAKGLGQVIGYQLQNMTGTAPLTLAEAATNAAVSLTVRLAVDNHSPLYGKVAIGGTRKRSFHSTVQSSVVQALFPLFSNGRFSDLTLDPSLPYGFVLSFLKSVERTWPVAVNDPESYLILRSVGVMVLGKILVRIFNNLDINPSTEDFDRVLGAIRDAGWDDSAWSVSPRSQINGLRAGYSLNRGNSLVADYLWALVPTKPEKSQDKA